MNGYNRWPLCRVAGMQHTAHDPGDPQITSHCPFCGSGQIVGRSDGTIGCDFCGMNYIVRVQPAFPGMPQAPGMGGAATDVGPEMMDPGMLGPDGMPMDPGAEMGPDGEPLDPDAEEGFPPDAGGGEEDEDAPPFGADEADDSGDTNDSDGPPPPKKKSKSKGKSKEGAYRTVGGDVLSEDAYVRHLAVLASGADPAVLARLRDEAFRG